MKRLNITILLFFIFAMSCIGQSQNIDIFSGTILINDKVTFGDTKQDIINAFGQPDDITTEYWEMDEKTATNYIYDSGIKFQFTDNSLESFVIYTSAYYIKMGTYKLQIGKNIKSLQSPFPKSYSYRGSGATSVALGAGDFRFFIIKYNSSNIISKIGVRFF